jgi:hypothetical protein
MSFAIRSAIIHLFRVDNITSISPKDLAETLSKRYGLERENIEDLLDYEIPKDYVGTIRLDNNSLILSIPGLVNEHRVPVHI